MAPRALNSMELLHPRALLTLSIRGIEIIFAIAAFGVTGSPVSAVKSYFQSPEFDDHHGDTHS